jgi:hypothetical protein
MTTRTPSAPDPATADIRGGVPRRAWVITRRRHGRPAMYTGEALTWSFGPAPRGFSFGPVTAAWAAYCGWDVAFRDKEEVRATPAGMPQ